MSLRDVLPAEAYEAYCASLREAGSTGGKARAKALTAARRTEIAKQAVEAREQRRNFTWRILTDAGVLEIRARDEYAALCKAERKGRTVFSVQIKA